MRNRPLLRPSSTQASYLPATSPGRHVPEAATHGLDLFRSSPQWAWAYRPTAIPQPASAPRAAAGTAPAAQPGWVAQTVAATSGKSRGSGSEGGQFGLARPAQKAHRLSPRPLTILSPARIRAMKPLEAVSESRVCVWTALALAGCLRPDPSKALRRLLPRGRLPTSNALSSGTAPEFALAMSVPAAMAALTSGTVARAGQVATRSRNARRLWSPNWASGSPESISRQQGPRVPRAGSGWAAARLNWLGWWPPTAGTDFRPYRNLTFQIRVEPKSRDAARTQRAS